MTDEPKVCISRQAALAAIGAISILERVAGVDEEIRDAMREIMDALVQSGKKPN